jgi:hypothetical protein
MMEQRLTGFIARTFERKHPVERRVLFLTPKPYRDMFHDVNLRHSPALIFYRDFSRPAQRNAMADQWPRGTILLGQWHVRSARRAFL